MKSSKMLVALLVISILAFSSACVQKTPMETTSTSIIQEKTTSASHAQTETQEKIVITDFAGRDVTLEKVPERIIVLTGYWTEILHILGLDDKIVGIGKYVPNNPYIPEEVKQKPAVGSSFKGLNWESVASLGPDLIIADWYGGKYKDKETIEKAEEIGIPVIALTAQSVEDNVKVVELLGKVFGKEEKAEELSNWMKSKLEEVNKIASQIPDDERKNVIIINAPKDINGPITVYAKGSAWASIVELVGAHNLAFDKEFDTQWPKLDLEKIIAYWGDKADVIIVTSFSQDTLEKTVNDIKNDPRWREIKAVKEGHVYGILAGSKGFLDWGPRIVVGVYQMGGLIYPEYYPEWKPVAKELFEKFYGLSYEIKVEVMDSAGRKVTFEKVPERVIVTSSYWAEVLHCLGLDDKIVGIDKYTPMDQFLPESVKQKPQIGSVYKGINWETVASLEPDLIVMGLWWGSFEPKEKELFERAEELNIPVLAFGIPDSNKTGTEMPYENIRIIRVLGKAFDKEREAEELASFLEHYYNQALEIASKIPEDKKKNVLIVYGSSITGKYATGTITVSTRGSAYAETAELVGGHNLAFDVNEGGPYLKLDLEKLIAHFGNKTDILIVVDWEAERLNEAVEKIKSDSSWQEIKAVKEGNVVGILVSSYKKDATALYGPRFITGIYAFGHAIYPEYYPNWEPIYNEILQKFYKIEG
ncbi:ABC transporter substrate-binding protein [Thermococcus sp. EP1]|uniref:ABC transporter substrate-binding protein n=1 Tax=Thermococcus sp. EP1 TaxID=1591054 RepID=UPI0006DB4044|nr:ABC transporter substrate-binding protein [Thermococcus sp. EP1]KPU62495.1 ABC transporter substrate-binding protein [Thermococcus sp. EP1]